MAEILYVRAGEKMIEPAGHDARLISLPEGVQVMRDNQLHYHWYNQITDASRHRLWNVMDKCLRLVSNPDIHIWRSHRREANQGYTYENVPLRREHLRQPALLETLYTGKGRLCSLPKIVPGQHAFIYDADEWETYNGKEGMVTAYSYFTGLHTIAFAGRRGTDEYPFYAREIMKACR